MSALPENQIAREARRVLRKLADPKARLAQRADGAWVVIQRGDPQSGRVKTGAPYVAAFRARGWIDPLPPPEAALVLSKAGRAWILGELGVDAFAAQHRTLRVRAIRDDSGEETIVAENDAESPLGWLKSRGAISDAQFEAGERLRRDYTIARLEPRMCIDLTAPVVLGSGGAANAAVMPDAVLAAKQRFAKAMSAVGPGLSDLLFDMCCALRGLESIEQDKRWPRRSGKVVLGLALDRLATHYGLNHNAPKPRLRSWSADFAEAAP
jgi:hypothetical protein